MFSLCFLRFLLFSILSVAVTTGSLLILCPASAHAQGGVPLWTNRYPGPAADSASPAHIAVDSSGNVFVTAPSRPSINGTDYTTIKYSNAGVPLWTNYYNGPDNDNEEPWAIAVDNSGNVFVTGRSWDPAYSYQECVTVACSNAGVPLWNNRYHSSFGEVGFAIAVDSSGNVFVPSITGVIKYSGSGTPLWTNRFSVWRAGIAVDRSGSVFVTGESSTGSNNDFATIAYSSAGVPLWTNRYNGPNNRDDSPTAIAVDSSGNVFVTGWSRTSGFQAGFSADYATVAYSNSGVPLWTNRYDGQGNPEPGGPGDTPHSIAVDSRGNVFVTGGSQRLSGFDYYDYATIAYSNSGVPLWTNRYDGPASAYDWARAVAVDSSGNVFVTGESRNNIGIPVDADYATIAYSNAGELLWEQRYDGPANSRDSADAIAVDSSGNVIVTGRSWNDGYEDYVTIKYSSSLPPPVHLDFQLLNNELVLSWTNAGFNLQSAPAITGTFTNIPDATSPYTNPLTGPQQFFRLKGN